MLATVLIVLLVVITGFGYYYFTASSTMQSNTLTISSLSATMSALNSQVSRLQGNLTQLQGAISAREALSVTRWLPSSTLSLSGTYAYSVKITNNNKFDVTLIQLTINIVDSTGSLVASNTAAQQILVSAGSSVTTSISVNFPSNGAGVGVQAVVNTPYGRITIGSI